MLTHFEPKCNIQLQSGGFWTILVALDANVISTSWYLLIWRVFGRPRRFGYQCRLTWLESYGSAAGPAGHTPMRPANNETDSNATASAATRNKQQIPTTNVLSSAFIAAARGNCQSLAPIAVSVVVSAACVLLVVVASAAVR